MRKYAKICENHKSVHNKIYTEFSLNNQIGKTRSDRLIKFLNFIKKSHNQNKLHQIKRSFKKYLEWTNEAEPFPPLPDLM